jgi:hypothetical protein
MRLEGIRLDPQLRKEDTMSELRKGKRNGGVETEGRGMGRRMREVVFCPFGVHHSSHLILTLCHHPELQLQPHKSPQTIFPHSNLCASSATQSPQLTEPN